MEIFVGVCYNILQGKKWDFALAKVPEWVGHKKQSKRYGSCSFMGELRHLAFCLKRKDDFMKTMGKRILTIILCLCLIVPLLSICVSADGATSGSCGENVTWEFKDSTLTISGSGAIADYRRVADLPWYEFKNEIKELIIEDGVTEFGEYAFSYCEKLTSVRLPNTITTINQGLFNYCRSLNKVIIPESVTAIETSAFSYCKALTEITIPESVTVIEEIAFGHCESLAEITIPKNVTTIGAGAFYGTSLTEITVPESVTTIIGNPFNSCIKLEIINVDENNPNYTSVDGVLFNKDKTELISYPSGKKDAIYTIPESVISITGGAFGGCQSLTSVTIPEGVTSIEDSTFSYCVALTEVTIPNSVTHIGDYVFYECTKLPKITIPEAVTSIFDNVFSNCEMLSEVTFEGSSVKFYDDVFANSTNIKAVYVPKGCIETYKSALVKQYIDYSETTSVSSLLREIGDTIETSQLDVSQTEEVVTDADIDEVADAQTSNEPTSTDGTTPIVPIIIIVLVVVVIAGVAVILLKKKK